MSGRSFGGRGSRRFGWLYAALAIVVALTASLMAVGPASQTSGSAEAAERVMPRSVVGDDTLGYWTPMGMAVDPVNPQNDPGLNNAVYALASYGGYIYAGGFFDDTGGGGDTPARCDDGTVFPLQCIARWAPATNAWSPVGNGLNNTVNSLLVMDDTLYVGGSFDDTVGGSGYGSCDDTIYSGALNCVAAWNGSSWSPLLRGLNQKVNALAVLGDDTLLVGGGFTEAIDAIPEGGTSGVAAWFDGTWTAPGVGGFDSDVKALVSDGPSVAYVGGQYRGDGSDDSGIMQMSGPFADVASWSPMSTGFRQAVTDYPGVVDALARLDDTVYAGGNFSSTGDGARLLSNLASWNGASWQTVGPGLNARGPTSVRALAVDDTRGLLYVGGTFDDTPGGYGNGQCDDTAIPGGPLRCVTVWDSAIEEFIPFRWGTADDSNGLTGEVSSFVVDDSVVYVGGRFNTHPEGGFPIQWNLKNIGKWTWNPPTGMALSASSGGVGANVGITGTGLIGVSSVRFGSTEASFERSTSTSLAATAPDLPPGTYTVTVNAVGGIATAGTYTVTSPNPPQPPTPSPPSAPRGVAATAGDASATITWQAPASAGSYLVTDYEVTSSPGGRICLVSTTTCRVTGLTNGTSYTFTARARTGAGWSVSSAPSNAVTPRAEPATSTIVITGTRSAVKATVTGKTTGFGMGGMVTAHTRTARGTPYTPGSTALVSTTGTFEWSRGVSKRKTLWVYFTGGDAKSNVLLLRP